MARGKIEKRGQRHRKIKPVILIVTEGSQTDAIRNARRLEQYHIQNGDNKPFGITVNPFTDIYQLVESLL